MKFKKDDEGKLVLDDKGDPIAVDNQGEVIPLDKVVSLAKFQRIESERDEYKASADKLTADIAELQKATGDKDDLAKKLAEMTADAEKAKAEFEGRMAARDKEHALDTALLGAGVPADRLRAAKALIEADKLSVEDGKLSGFDPESFKKDNTYLFETVAPVASAGASRGAAGGDGPDLAEARRVAGLPEPKE